MNYSPCKCMYVPFFYDFPQFYLYFLFQFLTPIPFNINSANEVKPGPPWRPTLIPEARLRQQFAYNSRAGFS